MKKNLIYLLFSVTLLCAALTACSDNDDLDSTSVVRPTTTEQNDLDRWLKRNYVETYNIQLKYRFEDIESSMGYYLTPASYKQSVAMAKLVRHMCLEAYDEITGSTDFIKAYFPKILFLVGSYAYKTNGAMVLGTAEAGAKITLYNLDNLNPKTVNAKTAYFKTIHHEFGHILNQTKPYPTDFAEISGPDYVPMLRNLQDHRIGTAKRIHFPVCIESRQRGFRGTHRPLRQPERRRVGGDADDGRRHGTAENRSQIRNRLQLHEKHLEHRPERTAGNRTAPCGRSAQPRLRLAG